MSRLEDSPVQSGDILAGKYRVERVLGVGGMGAVVAARHIDLDEVRAIKVMLPRALRVRETIERFMREARSVVRLKSPHVVKVFDVGRLEDGAPYMVMEYLEGRTVKTLLGGDPTPTSEVVDYVMQALEAVAEAHAVGLVHRDLKPSNLYLTEDADGQPSVKVLDFGISKLVTEGKAGEMTTTSDVLGSPFYMSPEQMRSTKDVDQRADLWSCGVILYQLLGGKVPFEGETITQVCLSVVQDEPLPLSELRPDLPAELVGVVMRCLKKDIEQRYQNAAELGEDLSVFGTAGASTSLKRIRRQLGAAAPSYRATRPLGAKLARPAQPPRPRPPDAKPTSAPPSAAGRGQQSTTPMPVLDADDEATAIQQSPAVAAKLAAAQAAAGTAGQALRVPSTIVMEERPSEPPAAEDAAADDDDDDDDQATIIQSPEAVQELIREATEARHADVGAPGARNADLDDSPFEETGVDQELPTRVLPEAAAPRVGVATVELPEQSAPATGMASVAGSDAMPDSSRMPTIERRSPVSSGAVVAAPISQVAPPSETPFAAPPVASVGGGGMPPEVQEAGATTAESWQQDGRSSQVEGVPRSSSRLLGVGIIGGVTLLVGIVVIAIVVVGSGDGDDTTAGRVGVAPSQSAASADGGAVVTSEHRAPSSVPADGPPPGMVKVAGGEYWFGCDPAAADSCFDDEKPGRLVQAAAFAIMHHEVSVAEYQRCVNAEQCPEPGKDAQCTWKKPGKEAHPINCVTWQAARSYCVHRGWRLPTEMEWEIAARGAERSDYPWGSETPSCERTVIASDDGGGCGSGGVLATGSRPKDVSWAKVFDLGGNVREWTASDYEPYPGGETDEDSAGKVNRGASWSMRAAEANTSHTRGVDPPDEARPDLGVRCAADL